LVTLRSRGDPARAALFPYPPLFRSQLLGGDVVQRVTADGRQLAGIGSARCLADRPEQLGARFGHRRRTSAACLMCALRQAAWSRSEEHTSELQSRENLLCRLLLETK